MIYHKRERKYVRMLVVVVVVVVVDISIISFPSMDNVENFVLWPFFLMSICRSIDQSITN